jgi:hypothetical protein
MEESDTSELSAALDAATRRVDELTALSNRLRTELSAARDANQTDQQEITGHLASLTALRIEKDELAGRLKRLNEAQSAQRTARARKVSELLGRADKQLAARKFIEPIGDNAVETLHQVMLLDPRNMAAYRGTETIKSEFRRLAAEAGANGDWTSALAYYRTVQRIDPADPYVAGEIADARDHQRTAQQRPEIDARQ